MKFYKFRGIACADASGKKIEPTMVYGNLITTTESGNYATIIPFKKEGEATRTYIVDPKTVAQFVGYDKNGNEVYDDDFLKEGYCISDVEARLADFEEYISECELAEE